MTFWTATTARYVHVGSLTRAIAQLGSVWIAATGWARWKIKFAPYGAINMSSFWSTVRFSEVVYAENGGRQRECNTTVRPDGTVHEGPNLVDESRAEFERAVYSIIRTPTNKPSQNVMEGIVYYSVRIDGREWHSSGADFMPQYDLLARIVSENDMRCRNKQLRTGQPHPTLPQDSSSCSVL